jgi:hypothetical protein
MASNPFMTVSQLMAAALATELRSRGFPSPSLRCCEAIMKGVIEKTVAMGEKVEGAVKVRERAET